MNICGDNRFEIIERAKKHLLEATNIETSADEMKVLDTFLFRCWQMGWLDRYDTADTPQTESYYKKEDVVRVVENVKRGYGLTKSAEDIVAEMQTDCGWK